MAEEVRVELTCPFGRHFSRVVHYHYATPPIIILIFDIGGEGGTRKVARRHCSLVLRRVATQGFKTCGLGTIRGWLLNTTLTN